MEPVLMPEELSLLSAALVEEELGVEDVADPVTVTVTSTPLLSDSWTLCVEEVDAGGAVVN